MTPPLRRVRRWAEGETQLAAFDTLLCGRLRVCTACGRSPVSQDGIWLGETTGAALAVAYALCGRCVAAGAATMRALDATLRRRYGVPEDRRMPPTDGGPAPG